MTGTVVGGATRSRWATVVVAAGLLLHVAGLEAGPARWVEVRTSHFTVLSDAGEKEAARIARQFERFRNALHVLWPWARMDSGAPILVYAARDEGTLKTLLPQFWEKKGNLHPAGVFQRGLGRSYVALRTDLAEPRLDEGNPFQVLYHEYVHHVLDLNFDRLPAWFNEGLAEFFGATLVRPDGIVMGRPIAPHVRRLREHTLPLAALVRIDHASPEYNEQDRASLFYAESWGLIHYLVFDEKVAESRKVSEFLKLRAQGVDDGEATRRVLGDLAELERAFDSYLHHPVFLYRLLKVDLETADQPSKGRELPPSEVAAARGELMLALNRRDDARALFEEALRGDSELAAAREGLGMLAWREGRTAEARRWLDQAVAQGGASGAGCYVQALLLLRQDKSPEALGRAQASLLRAVSLHPGLAPAFALLGEVDAWRGGNPEEALAIARRATALEPSVGGHHLAVARILLGQGKTEEARTEGRHALATARTERQAEAARHFLSDLGGRKDPPGTPAPRREPADPPE